MAKSIIPPPTIPRLPPWNNNHATETPMNFELPEGYREIEMTRLALYFARVGISIKSTPPGAAVQVNGGMVASLT